MRLALYLHNISSLPPPQLSRLLELNGRLHSAECGCEKSFSFGGNWTHDALLWIRAKNYDQKSVSTKTTTTFFVSTVQLANIKFPPFLINKK